MTAFGFKTTGQDEMNAKEPTGRVGTPSDVGGLALFLCSPAGSYVTGAHVLLDGGATLARDGLALALRL